jgi:hypothetical protein
MLQQQQQNRAAAGVGGKPIAMPVQNFQPGVPTLSSAQFAALVGAQNADQGLAAAPVEGIAADPTSGTGAMAAAQQAHSRLTAPLAPALKLSGTPPRTTMANAAGESAAKRATDADDGYLPTITRAANPRQVSAVAATPTRDADLPTITRKGEPITAATATESAEEQPAESETASKSDPNVIHLKHPPDKDQIKEFRMRNQRWVVDETPGARQLFFGADGVFGWDDFLDLINPLQHIPGIAQIYRAVTGDEINGAASLLGAIPFGPLGGVGLIGSVVELAVKDVTGNDIGGNLVAMVFGDDKDPKDRATPIPADMADAAAMEEAVGGRVTVQTASRQTSFTMSEASELHSACRG